MPSSTRPGDVLAGRYRLVDLLQESGGGLFWRAHDRVLARHVALHVIASDDDRAPGLLRAARHSATVSDRRLLRVLDAEERDGICYVVNEWGSGTSLDVMLTNDGPLSPRRAAWIVSEVGIAIATAHAAGATHGRLVPENVLIDNSGNVRVVGFAVDAALHGLPEGRQSADVVDLAALVYAALTGKWAGVSRSNLPAAPDDNGRVLRPRQVRAGVPRPLDALCDEVINAERATNGGSHARVDHDLRTARGITELLCEFVGDPTSLVAEEEARRHGPPPNHVTPPPPDESTGTDIDHVAPPAPEPPYSTPASANGAAAPAPTAGEQPTQAGLPIFDDEADDVSWLNPRSDAPPPPPPFEEPPERPLFAPDPPPGSRTPATTPGEQHPSPVPTPAVPGPGPGPGPGGYWPWDTSTGSGPITGTTEQVVIPGRSWLRLAGIVAGATLLLVAVVFAYHFGSDNDESGTPGTDVEPTTVPTTGEPVEISSVADFDPQGNGDENPDRVALTHDGDPATAWPTLTYDQNFGPGGLKFGLGLVIDLGSARTVSGIDLKLVGEPTDVEVYVTDASPASVDDLTPVAAETLGTDAAIDLAEPAEGRFVTVWLTSIPGVEGGKFRAEVAEVAVRG